MKISLAIAHTPWVPERVRSMDRLRQALRHSSPSPLFEQYEFTERSPNWVWSALMWEWSVGTDADWCLFLQDDVIAAPNFWPALRAMLEALPNSAHVVGLEVAHPAAPALAEEGYRFFTTTDALVGVGYAIRGCTLTEFLGWRAQRLKAGAIEAITEDTLLGLFCACREIRIWHPLPTIIDHDVSIESSYGNDTHPNRRPLVRWDSHSECPLEHAQNWRQGPPPAHLGRFYESTPNLAATYVKDWTTEKHDALVRDNGYSFLRSLSRKRALRLPEPTARVCIATRSRAFCHEEHKATIANLVGMPDVYVDARFSVDRVQTRSSDVVKASSILVSDFLSQTDGTHLFFVDSDVSFSAEMLRGMLATGKDFVAAPYPAREGINWKRAAKSPPELAEAFAYHYRLHLLDDDTVAIEADGTVEVKHMPLGACLVSRSCLQQMTDYYGGKDSRLMFRDRTAGAVRMTVALFMLLLDDGELWSEDFSFCERWRMVGGKVWMYLGDGAPATHHGDHAFRGRIEAFGVRRLDE